MKYAYLISIFNQKSVVLLSKFPFVSLFSYILNLIAVEYFTTGGGEVLETGKLL